MSRPLCSDTKCQVLSLSTSSTNGACLAKLRWHCNSILASVFVSTNSHLTTRFCSGEVMNPKPRERCCRPCHELRCHRSRVDRSIFWLSSAMSKLSMLRSTQQFVVLFPNKAGTLVPSSCYVMFVSGLSLLSLVAPVSL